MLVIGRKKGESLLIGENVEINVVKIENGSVKIGINAPREITILRKELYTEVTDENQRAMVFDASILEKLNNKSGGNMDIGGNIKNDFIDMSSFQKKPESNKVSKPTENNNQLRNKDNSEKEVKNAVNKINKFLEGEGTHLQYEQHDVFNEMIIKVIDNKTDTVLNEIPSKQILDMVAKMCEMAGILVDKKA
ncbi:carbon storage regulator CsrA [Clostridium estertheticum]|nr:carbon storage regulator CsrA [Clostridium estertheticum]MBX4269203.1 carbon storage regulator CsrA [Clostridium estertheticum]WLC79439.1 carbon storage regulator CsrA [Clostridium estertheticum]WLC90465.1 carbon storage regulator CsrA [Clostridium estertheticum]